MLLRHLKIIFVALTFFLSGSCRSSPALDDSDFSVILADAYIQLHLDYYFVSNGDSHRIGSYDAGGVCVQSLDSSSVILTVNHFCNGQDSAEVHDLMSRGLIWREGIAKSLSGQSSNVMKVIASSPENDLCLVQIKEFDCSPVQGIQDISVAHLFDPIINIGAPLAIFNAEPRSLLFRQVGTWSGYCNDTCNMPDTLMKPENFIAHSIPTSLGQSGSPIFMGRNLFSIQVANISSIDNFGIGACPIMISNFLDINGIDIQILE